MVLDVTRRCNLRCQMCQTWRRQAEHELTPSEIEQLLGSMPQLVWLDVTGGEPFVRRDIEQVLTAAATAPPALAMLHFQTNGWQTERIASLTAKLRRAKTDLDLIVTVSVDGPANIHDAMRGRVGSYTRAIATANALAEIPGVDVHIGTTVTAANAEHVSALGTRLQDELASYDPRRWHLNLAQTSEHFYGEVQADQNTTVDNGSEIVRAHLARRGLPRSLVEAMETAYLINLQAIRGGTSQIPCQALRSTAFVAPEGDVFPCHIYDRPLGNVRQRPFAEIWNSQAVHQARADIKQLACGGCFSACEAYPALAGAPVRAATVTAQRLLRMIRS